MEAGSGGRDEGRDLDVGSPIGRLFSTRFRSAATIGAAVAVVGIGAVTAYLVLRGPTYTPEEMRSFDHEAQAQIHAALVDQMVIAADRHKFTADTDELSRFDDKTKFGSWKPEVVVVKTANDDQTLCLGSQSQTGKRFYLKIEKLGASAPWYATSSSRSDKIRICDSSTTDWSQDPSIGWG